MAALQPIHGTVVSIGGKGVLITGPSGAGKSDLALRLIDRGALLVADDQVALTETDAGLIATAPARLAGFLEVRGLGIVPQPFADMAPVCLVVALVPPTDVPRLPEPAFYRHGDTELPLIHLNAFEVSTAIKIEWALRHPDWIASGGPDDRTD